MLAYRLQSLSREARQGTEEETMEKCCLLAFFSGLFGCLPCPPTLNGENMYLEVASRAQ